MIRSYHLVSLWVKLLDGAAAYCGDEGKAFGAKEAEGSVAKGGSELSKGVPNVRGCADVCPVGVCGGAAICSACGLRIFAVAGGGIPVRAGCLCPACTLLPPPLLGVLRLGDGLPGDDDLEAEGGAAPYFSRSC